MRQAKKTARKSSSAVRRKGKQVKQRMSKKAMRRQGRQTKKKSAPKKKGKKGPTDWNMHLMKVYKEMKAKDSKVRFGDAMKSAKKTYKQAKSAAKSKWTVASQEWSTMADKQGKQDGGKCRKRTKRR